MSILAASATNSSQLSGILVTAALVGAVVVIAAIVHARRPTNLLRPDRIMPWQSAWPLFWVMIVTLVLWFLAQTSYIGLVFARRQRVGEPMVFDESSLAPADWAVLATAPAIL